MNFPDRRFPFDQHLDSLLRKIPEPYECPHCKATVPKGGALHVVNAGTGAERRYCSAKCRFEGRPTFTIYICHISLVKPCAARLAEENRGLVGWHPADRCPDCTVTPFRYELWGENYHLQGHSDTKPSDEWLADYALRHGQRLRIIFQEGSPISYLA